DLPGAPPTEPLALLEGGKNQREARAQIKKAGETRCGAALFARRLRRNAEVDACHHQRRNQRGVPEHPLPGEMVSIPAVERRRNVDRTIHEDCIKSDRERKEPQRNIAKRERQCEWIESAR